MPSTLRIALTIATLAALGGCSTRSHVEQAVALDVSGTVGVDIETIGGDVTIRADPDIKQPRVIVSRQSTHGPKRRKEAAAALEEIQSSVEVVSGEFGPLVQIRSSTTHAEPHFLRTTVRVEVPQIDGLWIRMPRGAVDARGVGGPIDIRTADGDVLVATPRPLRDPIRIVNQHGDITMRVRGESSGELDLQAQGGRAFSRIRQGHTIVHRGTDHDTVLASFNDGSNPIVLRTLDGTISFIVMPNPLSYAAAAFD